VSIDTNESGQSIFTGQISFEIVGSPEDLHTFLEGVPDALRGLGSAMLNATVTDGVPYLSREQIRDKLDEKIWPAFEGLNGTVRTKAEQAFKDQGLESVGDLIALGWKKIDSLQNVGRGSGVRLREYFAQLEPPLSIDDGMPTITRLARIFGDPSQIPVQAISSGIDIRGGKYGGRRISISDAVDRTNGFTANVSDPQAVHAQAVEFTREFLKVRAEIESINGGR